MLSSDHTCSETKYFLFSIVKPKNSGGNTYNFRGFIFDNKKLTLAKEFSGHYAMYLFAVNPFLLENPHELKDFEQHSGLLLQGMMGSFLSLASATAGL